MLRLSVVAFLAVALAACATQAPPDYTPPAGPGLDAKTTLENAPRR